MGKPLLTFHAGFEQFGVEKSVDGIVSESGLSEESAPGVVLSLFVHLPTVGFTPERRSLVNVRGVDYAVERVIADEIGGATILLRRSING